MSQVSNILLKNLGISGMPSSRLRWDGQRNMFCVKTIGLWETKEKLWSLYLPNGETRLANFGVSNPFWWDKPKAPNHNFHMGIEQNKQAPSHIFT